MGLACTIYEIRAGTQLFASFCGTHDEIIRQIIQTFGKLPYPWWSKWDHRATYSDEDGKPNKAWPNGIAVAVEYPLEAQIRDIGADDDDVDSSSAEGVNEVEFEELELGKDNNHNSASRSIMESPGTRLSEAEVADLKDLLCRMLVYSLDARISVEEALRHAWFWNKY